MLAYHALVTDIRFEGRFGLVQPLTLGGRQLLQAIWSGKHKIGAAAREATNRVMSRILKSSDNKPEDVSFFFGGGHG